MRILFAGLVLTLGLTAQTAPAPAPKPDDVAALKEQIALLQKQVLVLRLQSITLRTNLLQSENNILIRETCAAAKLPVEDCSIDQNTGSVGPVAKPAAPAPPVVVPAKK